MQKTSKKYSLLVMISCGTLLLNACASDQEIAMAKKVITALPQEVAGCQFLGNVDTGARATIANARFDLQLQTAALGGTHLVETHAYSALLGFRDIGVALSGRAYKCPLDHKLSANHEELLKQDQEARNEKARDEMDQNTMIQLNADDGLFTL